MLAAVKLHEPDIAILQEPRLGTRIDDFTVAYRIARGMNADVFAVWHHALRTPLICKRLRPADENNAKWRRLLHAEGAALARLYHPGIVRLVGRNDCAKLPYLLLEHVGSKTLRDMLKENNSFDTEQAVLIVQHIGAAIAYAHARGYVHRDLKPSNIILRGGRPVLLDFGVVWRWTGGQRPPDRSGTPQYLAPEQVTRDPLTPRTDVYGLGVLLFELLTGVRPFPLSEAYRDVSAPLAERYPQLTKEPLTLRHAGRRVPAKLQETISRAVARDSRARWPSVEEFLAALDQFTRTKVWPRDAIRGNNSFKPFEV